MRDEDRLTVRGHPETALPACSAEPEHLIEWSSSSQFVPFVLKIIPYAHL